MTITPLPDGSWRWMLSWRTDVRQAADGTEQRAATTSHPQAAYAGTYLLSDADARTVHRDLRFGPVAAYSLPLAHEATPALAAVTGASVTVDATYCDWLAVGRGVLIAGPGASYTTTISALPGGGVLTLAAGPPSGTYPAAVTMVYPLEPLLLEAGRLDRHPVNLTRWQVVGRQQTARAIGGAGGAAVTTFGGLPVIIDRPISPATTPEEFDGAVTWHDAGGGLAISTYQDRARRSRSGTWQISTPAERQRWKVLLGTLRGRWKPARMATWRPDFTLYAQPAGSATAIRVIEDLTLDGWTAAILTHLQLEYADGSVTHHAVSAITDGGAYHEITLTALPPSIPGGLVRVVSILETVRLAADEVIIEYAGNWIGRVTLAVVNVEPWP